MRKVHEVRFVEFDESKYMDNEISQESQSQDRTMDQEATEAGEDAGEAADGNPTGQDTADSEEGLQGDTIIRSSEQSWNGGKEKNSAWQNV
ncbi:hypothetical protein HRG_012368 [Hirsutella rhossiliensis]